VMAGSEPWWGGRGKVVSRRSRGLQARLAAADAPRLPARSHRPLTRNTVVR
jgi:hypothetical protein